MIRRRTIATSWTISSLFMCALTHSIHAQAFYFLDDFEDGSVVDGNPVTWTIPVYADGATREVIDGSYVHRAPATFFGTDVDVADRVYRDGSLRTQFKMFGDQQGVGLYFLSTLAGPPGSGDQGLQLFSELDGNSTGELDIVLFRDGTPTILAQTFLGYDPTGVEMHMQFDLVGHLATLSAWQDGTPQPSEPMLTYDVSQVPDLPAEGRIGLYTVAFDANAVTKTTEFRFFQAVPEPSSAILAGIAMWGIFPVARRPLSGLGNAQASRRR